VLVFFDFFGEKYVMCTFLLLASADENT
jgi:hypothetical protein